MQKRIIGLCVGLFCIGGILLTLWPHYNPGIPIYYKEVTIQMQGGVTNDRVVSIRTGTNLQMIPADASGKVRVYLPIGTPTVLQTAWRDGGMCYGVAKVVTFKADQTEPVVLNATAQVCGR